MPGRQDWQLGSWEWLSFASALPADPIPLPGISVGTLAMAGRCILTGCSGLNLSTANGHLDVYDGMDNTGVPAWRFSVSASGTANTSLPNRGVKLDIGCFVVPSGITFSGSVLLIPLWHYPDTPPGE